MKTAVKLLAAVLFVSVLVVSNGIAAQKKTAPAAKPAVKPAAVPAELKKLVIYYSYSGNTEKVAKLLAEEIKADVVKIEDVQQVSKFKAYASGIFASRQGKSWPIKPLSIDYSQYDKIFLGCPVWANSMPPQMNGFLSTADFKNKHVILFMTLGGNNSNQPLKQFSRKIKKKNAVITSYFTIKTGGSWTGKIESQVKDIAQRYK